MIKKLIIIGLISGFVSGCLSAKKENQRVIVAVGDGSLTIEQLNSAIPTSIQPNVSQEQINNYLQQWIEMELVYRDALRSGMDRENEFINEFENAKREILVRMYLDRKLSEIETVTETEALDYYNENKDSYMLPDDEIRALHILVSTSAEANNVYRRIRNGEDFETVAREVSKDFSENKRIDLGYFRKDDVVPEIAPRVFSYRVGSLTRPLPSEFGFHIFKIIDRKRKGTYRKFEEVRDQIVARLKSIKKNEKYRDLIIELRNKTDIKRNIKLLKELYQDSTYIQKSQMIVNSK